MRLMPNTPMMVGAGCTAYCVGRNVSDYDISVVRAILEATGICQRVPEYMMDAVSALSGAGPAFVSNRSPKTTKFDKFFYRSIW